MKYILSICALLFALDGVAQARALSKALANSPRAYALFDKVGKPVAWPDLVEAAREADVVLFGEYHDDPIMHWLQAELIRDLLAADIRPALGAEMLEADDQLVVDEFLAGWVSDDKLKAAANLWPNHFTDYHPLLELAKAHELPFIATNVPRRYASYVYQHGLASLQELSEEAKAFLPPLPVPFDITLPGYDAMLGHGRWTRRRDAPDGPGHQRRDHGPFHPFELAEGSAFCSLQWRLPQPRWRRCRVVLASGTVRPQHSHDSRAHAIRHGGARRKRSGPRRLPFGHP